MHYENIGVEIYSDESRDILTHFYTLQVTGFKSQEDDAVK